MVQTRREVVTLRKLQDELQDVLSTGQFNPERARIAHETLADIRDTLAHTPDPNNVRLDGRTVDIARVHIWAAFCPEHVDEEETEY